MPKKIFLIVSGVIFIAEVFQCGTSEAVERISAGEDIDILWGGSVKGIVEYSCFMGAYQDYHIKVGDSLVKIQEYNPKNKKIYRGGDVVYLNFEDNTLYAL